MLMLWSPESKQYNGSLKTKKKVNKLNSATRKTANYLKSTALSGILVPKVLLKGERFNKKPAYQTVLEYP